MPSPLLYAPGWPVIGTSQIDPFVLQVNLQVPASSANFGCPATIAPACLAAFQLYDLASYLAGMQPGGTGGLSFGGLVYVAR
jgi:hypothetical protein